MQNGSPAVLGMQDIDKLGLISINYDTMQGQVAEDDNTGNSESPSQTEGDKCEQFKGKSRKKKHKVHKMQAIYPNHLLSLIQWSWVTITMI